jgi:hypothetical protein
MSNMRSFTATSGEGIQYLDTFTNWEQQGVPKGAGADTPEGFDLVKLHYGNNLLYIHVSTHVRACFSACGAGLSA